MGGCEVAGQGPLPAPYKLGISGAAVCGLSAEGRAWATRSRWGAVLVLDESQMFALEEQLSRARPFSLAIDREVVLSKRQLVLS